uniref:GRF-type domain-containing protein n=1 Tax=Heterorhabditis bacteriophora TaxID=37862 RepID=A0A1I7XPR7_HETBA
MNCIKPLSPRKDRNKETQVREDERVTAGKDRRRVISPPPRNSQLSPKSPAPSSDGLITKRAQGRPKQYKVEKTPPIGVNGQRNCTFCNGQVRPQMCGGNKHRWRCVDKKCRKWYGWVRSNEEVPRDLGKKGRWKDAANRITKKAAITLPPQEPSSISSQGEAANAVAELDSASMSDVTLTSRSPLRTEIQPQIKKKLGRPPKQQGLKIRLKTAKDKKDENRTKRKYTKRKDKETMDILKNLTSNRREESPKPPLSPLTPRQMRYRPCAMEKRSRWWTSEKRRVDVSPDRDFQTGPADAAAAFRIMSHAFRAAAVTRADELGTVNGTLDLLMDSLLGSMAPLLSLLSRLPSMRAKPEVMQRLWNSSAIHLPMFQ